MNAVGTLVRMHLYSVRTGRNRLSKSVAVIVGVDPENIHSKIRWVYLDPSEKLNKEYCRTVEQDNIMGLTLYICRNTSLIPTRSTKRLEALITMQNL